MSGSLAAIGQDAESVMAHADSEEIKLAMNAQTQEAKSLGIFGSPTFVVGKEIFWGDDRLEDAIQWAMEGRIGASRHEGGRADAPSAASGNAPRADQPGGG